jgi:2-polyprenyl-6-methoxyphenol hydroxylase-like FAD-dependent oxidoreductase
MLDEELRGEPGFCNSDSEMVAIAPVKGGMTYVATGAEVPQGHRVNQPEARELPRDVLGRFSAPTPTALRAKLTDDQTVLVHPYEWILVPAPWHLGRVTLIGDAAHATTAHLSSGGGMALEDAVVPAEELASTPSPATAFERFHNRRYERVKVVVEASTRLLEMHRAGASAREMGALRARATTTLIQPY